MSPTSKACRLFRLRRQHMSMISETMATLVAVTIMAQCPISGQHPQCLSSQCQLGIHKTKDVNKVGKPLQNVVGEPAPRVARDRYTGMLCQRSMLRRRLRR